MYPRHSPLLETTRLNPIIFTSPDLPPLRTTLPSLDAHLHGGLLPQSLSEIFAPPGAGKTSLALTMVADVALEGSSALVLDCDGGVTSARILQLIVARATRRKGIIDFQAAASRVRVARVISWEALVVGAVHLLREELERGKTKLVVVDALASLFRLAEGEGIHKRLEGFAMRMQGLAVEFGLCVIIVNHTKAIFGDGEIVGAMGEGWQYVCATRLRLREQHEGSRIIELIKSPLAGRICVRFDIEEAGVIEVED